MIKQYIKYIYYVSSKPILLFLLVSIVLGLSFPIFNIHLDTDGQSWLPKNSKKLFYKNLHQQIFGSDELIILYLKFADTTTQEYHLLKLKQINDSIVKNLHGFDKVFSKYSITQIKDLTNKKYANELNKAYFNLNDSLGEILFIKQKADKNIIKDRPLLIDSLRKQLSKIVSPQTRIAITGQGIIFDEINRLSTSDSILLFSICFVLILVLLWWQVHNFKYLLLSLWLIIFSLIPALSLFGWLNIPFSMITMTAPLLFVINFSSYAIHFITKESQSVNKYILKKIPPVFTSALSSIIGFGSLWISNIQIISQFGLLTALGIIIGLFSMVLVGIPFVVRFVAWNKNLYKQKTLNLVLEHYYNKLNYKTSIILFSILIFLNLLAIFLFPRIDIDTNMIHFMKPENKARKSIEFIQKNYGSANIVEYIVHKKDGSKLTNKDFKKVHQLAQKLNHIDFITNVVDYNLWKPVIAKTSLYMPQMAKELSRSFLSNDKKYANFILNLPTGSVQEMKKMLDSTKTIINQELSQTQVQINSAGFLPLYIEQMDTIVSNMLSGLALAVLLILLIMILLVRNIKLGLISILISLFPLFILVIIMDILKIPFDIGTTIIFSVIIGMIADDVLHIIWNLKQNLKSNKNMEMNKIFAVSVQKIIYPCIVTSIMFSAGFFVLFFSNLSIISHFGLLSTATIILAWISDFWLFPAILIVFYKQKKQNNK